ncbi:MAG: hypothetical protein IJU98_04825 [Synergistaceae bacterium]|nr:hypothetical protein [Synergistaceae bacterium]
MRSENGTRQGRETVRAQRGGAVPKILLGLVLLLAVMGGILSFVDIGGNLILEKAQKMLREDYSLELAAAGISGNPVRGYTLRDFSLSTLNGDKILSAQSLSGRVNFMALFRGSLRLAELAIGGVDMDLDEFIKEIQKIKLPEGEGGGSSEIPLDRLSLEDSRFTSQWGTVEVSEIGANITSRGTAQNLVIDVDGRVNGIPVRGGVDLDAGEGVVINRSDIGFGMGKILATGGIRPVSPTDKTNTLDLHGSVEGLDLKELTALWPSALRPEDYEGKASVNVEATGTSETLKLVGSLDYKGVKIGGYPVERAGADVRYSGGRVTVNNIQASVLGVPLAGEIAIATNPGQVPSVMVKLEGHEADLDGLSKVFPELKGLGGRVSSFSANIQGPANALSGTVNLSAPRFSYEDNSLLARPLSLANVAAQLKLSKGDTATLNGKLTVEGAQGYLQGTVASLLSNPKLDLTAKLVDLDLNRAAGLIPDTNQYGLAGKVTASIAVKGSPDKPTLSGTVSSGGSLSGMGQTLSKPSVSFSFANGTFSLQKSAGTLNGMPINVSGTVGPLPSATPSMNVNATVTVSPAALKAYVPDIESYALKGNVNAGVKIQGKLPNPSVSLVISSPSLQAMNLLAAKDIEVTTALGGDLAKLDKISMNAKATSLSASGVSFSNLAAGIDKNGNKITLSKLSARSGSGTVTGSGGADLGGKDPKLDFSFKLDKLDLGSLAKGAGVALKGALTGALKVSGTASNPAFAFTASVPSITAEGLALTNLAADVSGTAKALKLNTVKAEVNGAPLTATGSVQFSPLNASVAIRGNGLDLAALTKDYPDLKGQLSGKANLTFDITGGAKGISGKGALASSAVRAYGLTLKDVDLPLTWSGNVFASKGGTAKVYNGTAKNSLTYDIAKSSFTDQLDASGVDVNALIQDVTGGLGGGKITGQGKLSLKLNGSAAKGVTYSGSGQFSVGSGAITGFKWLDLATRIHGVKGLQYKSVTAPFALQTGKLILKSGSIANAPNGDPIYIYAKLTQDGSINFSGKEPTLNLMAEGQVNYQLINALVGGGKGGLAGLGNVIKGGAKGLEDGLKQILGGGLSGAKEQGSTGDYRTVSLKISGKVASPSFSNLKIGESTLKDKAKDKKMQESPTKATVKPAQPTTPAQPAVQPEQPKQEPKKSVEEQVKDRLKEEENKLKEEVNNQLKKGLGGLFKKR